MRISFIYTFVVVGDIVNEDRRDRSFENEVDRRHCTKEKVLERDDFVFYGSEGKEYSSRGGE